MAIGRWLSALVVCGVLVCGVLVGCKKDPAPPEASSPPKAAVTSTPAATKPAEAPKNDPIVVQGVGFAEPESAVYDAESDVYIVSNIGGKALEKDDNGFLSRVYPTGEVSRLKWVEGGKNGVELNAPKGMAIAGGKLYVADIDVLRTFDLATGDPVASIAVETAKFLNDVAAGPDGVIYFSDSGLEQWGPYVEPNGRDAVYRLDGDKPRFVATGKELGLPNGIAVGSDGVWVVNRGGEVYRIGADGKKADVARTPQGSLDGVVITESGVLYTSSWDAKGIYRREADGSFERVIWAVDAPADIGYDGKRKRLLIPQLTDGILKIVPL